MGHLARMHTFSETDVLFSTMIPTSFSVVAPTICLDANLLPALAITSYAIFRPSAKVELQYVHMFMYVPYYFVMFFRRLHYFQLAASNSHAMLARSQPLTYVAFFYTFFPS